MFISQPQSVTKGQHSLHGTGVTTSKLQKPLKVAIIGSGNWGSTVARIIGQNVLEKKTIFDSEVKMFVRDTDVDGCPLTEIINTVHENKKYMPGYKIPENIIALPDLVDVSRDADILVFVVPSQYVKSICLEIKDHIKPQASAISLVKGLDHTGKGLNLASNVIQETLGIANVCVLMGANIALEIAKEMFAEATIGCQCEENGAVLKELFHTQFFKISVVKDINTVELCGALKNVVAVGAGIVDALGYGNNTKAAIIRIGLKEMIQFAQRFYDNVNLETFYESCGIADLITTCYGGRNRLAGEHFVKSGMSFEDVEEHILGGQKLQGPHVAYEVYQLLKENSMEKEFPLFVAIYNVCFENHSPEEMMEALKEHF